MNSQKQDVELNARLRPRPKLPTGPQRTLWLLLVSFALPVVFAYFTLSQNWYQGGATNKGQLLNAISYASLQLENPKPQQWQLISLLPAQCDPSCYDRLAALRQTHIALGREQARVQSLIFVTDQSDKVARSELAANKLLEVPLVNAPAPLAQWALIIVDPLGQWVMAYPFVSEQQAQIAQGRDLLSDLRKLLKLSRIG